MAFGEAVAALRRVTPRDVVNLAATVSLAFGRDGEAHRGPGRPRPAPGRPIFDLADVAVFQLLGDPHLRFR
jgi:hypothetical protein